METTTTETATVHPFERAGLGQAPFRCVGFSVEKFQTIPGDPNCPMQPGASCDYCATGIYNVCHIKSADGKRFKVGADCVRKVDKKIAKIVDKKIATVAKEKKAVKVAEAIEALGRPEVRAALSAMPHPRGFSGETMLDQVEWMMSHAGTAGKLRTAKIVMAVVNS